MSLNLSILLMSLNISTDLKGANEEINCTMDDVQDYFLDHCVMNDILDTHRFLPLQNSMSYLTILFKLIYTYTNPKSFDYRNFILLK